MADKDALGRRGERIAERFLVDSGYTVVERNWRCPQGEIDLIARHAGVLVVVEVKTRSSTAFGHPLAAITPPKLARLKRLAAAWCRAHPGSHAQVRLDAVGVILPRFGPVTVEHLRGIS